MAEARGRVYREMASASSLLSEEQFLCSICLDVFTDPITTPCGHNYCNTCITHYWDTRAVCPLCNETFDKRPKFSVNKVLSEMADQFRKTQDLKNNSNANQEPAERDEVSCDVVCSRDVCSRSPGPPPIQQDAGDAEKAHFVVQNKEESMEMVSSVDAIKQHEPHLLESFDRDGRSQNTILRELEESNKQQHKLIQDLMEETQVELNKRKEELKNTTKNMVEEKRQSQKLTQDLQCKINKLTIQQKEREKELLISNQQQEKLTQDQQDLRNQVEKLTVQLQERDTELQNTTNNLEGKDKLLKERDDELQKTTKNLEGKEAELQNTTKNLEGKDKLLKERDAELQNTTKNLEEKDKLLKELTKKYELLKGRETALQNTTKNLEKKHKLLKELTEKYTTDLQNIFKKIDDVPVPQECNTTTMCGSAGSPRTPKDREKESAMEIDIKQLMLTILEDLGTDDFKLFKWNLQIAENFPGRQVLPKSCMEKADKMETVDLLVQNYPKNEIQIMENVLKKIGRNDLRKTFTDSCIQEYDNGIKELNQQMGELQPRRKMGEDEKAHLLQEQTRVAKRGEEMEKELQRLRMERENIEKGTREKVEKMRSAKEM